MAVASMVVGIVGLVACALCGPVAWYLAVLARRQMTAGGYDGSSQGMATAGFIMGIIGTAILGLYAFVFVLGIGLGW